MSSFDQCTTLTSLCISLGYVAENDSFYASLRGNPTPQDQEFMSSSSYFINDFGEITDQRFVTVPLIPLIA